jgi:hypothetical protein
LSPVQCRRHVRPLQRHRFVLGRLVSAIAIAREHATHAVDFDKRIVLAGIIDFIDMKER